MSPICVVLKEIEGHGCFPVNGSASCYDVGSAIELLVDSEQSELLGSSSDDSTTLDKAMCITDTVWHPTL